MAAGATRQGTDTCGGAVLAPPQTTVYANGALWAVIGTPIAPHGDSPHDSAVMSGGSSTVFIEGIAVCRQGDA